MADFDPDKYLERKKKSEPFDPDKYLAKTRPETATQTLGRSTASLADTALNTVRGLADIPVRAAARAYYGGVKGVPLEQQEPLLQNVSNAILPQQDTFGKMFGVTGTPGYENAPLRRVGTAIGETIGENVIQPISQATGLPAEYVGDVVNLGAAAVAPAVPKVASATVSGAQKVAPLVKAPIDIGKGFYQGARGVEPGSAKSAVVPLRDTYYPTPEVQQFMRGDIDLPTLQASQRPSSSLFATPEQQSALRMAERMPGEPNVPLIPVQGKGMQAFGERVGREYVTDPYRAAADVGLSVVAGIPLPLSAAQRALQARQSRTLSQTANFDPAFRQRLAQAEAQQPIPPSPGPIAPQNMMPSTGTAMVPAGPLTQMPPSVIPMPGPQRNVNIEGQSFTLPNQINTTNVSPAGAPQQATPTIDLAQLAAQRSAQEAAKSTQTVQQVAAQKVSGPVVPAQIKPTKQTTTPATTTRSSAEIRKQMDALDNQMTMLRDDALAEGLTMETLEGQAYRNQLDSMFKQMAPLEKELKLAIELEKKQARQAKKKAPSNVSQMLIGDEGSKVYPNKKAFEKESIFSTLKDEPHTGSYIEGDKIIHVEKVNYGNLPKDVTKDFQQTKTYATDKQGNRVPIGKEWTDADPEPLTSALKRKFKREE
jgi:hypothetical protein